MKNESGFQVRADCMCNRRFCTHPAWSEVQYGKHSVPGNWAFRYVVQDAEPFSSSVIEKITGLKGAFEKDSVVFKVASPRTDVKVSVDGAFMAPFRGLTSWAAFQAGKKTAAMVMGDLVLFQDEVNPVMTVLLDAGLSVTALHNHFFYDEPKTYFMHLEGEGTTETLATGIRKAFDKVKEIRAARPAPASGFGGALLPAESSIPVAAVEEIIGQKGQAKDGMLKFVIGRTVQAACGCEVGKEMGVNTWAVFAGSEASAAVDGDFAVPEELLQPVLKALRKADINVVAIHHHMVGESPRVIFLHYWGRGPALDMARGLRKALHFVLEH